MIDAKIYNKIEKFVKSNITLDMVISGHDWHHSVRVMHMSRKIIKIDKIKDINRLIVDISSLLHDVSDHKFNGGDYELGSQVIDSILRELPINEDTMNIIKFIINNISYSNPKKVELPIEGKIVKDADMLDSMGAIGIARTFAYGAKKSRMIWDTNLIGTSIIHFSNKLFKLKDLMYTDYAKLIAEKRHNFMKEYYQRFFNEIEMEE